MTSATGCDLDAGRPGGAGLGATLIETEGWIPVRHQARVRHDARDPAVEPEHEVEDAAGIAPGEDEREAGEEDEQADEAARERRPTPVVRPRCRERPASDHDRDQQVLRDRQEPPLDEHEAAREVLGILDVQRRRVVGRLVEGERRVPVGAQGAVRVEGDPPRPAEDADVEVEDPPRIPPGDEDREERHDGQHEEREPQERKHDVVRDREQPLDDPEPPAQVGVEPALEAERMVGVLLGAVVHGAHFCSVTRATVNCRPRGLPAREPCLAEKALSPRS